MKHEFVVVIMLMLVMTSVIPMVKSLDTRVTPFVVPSRSLQPYSPGNWTETQELYGPNTTIASRFGSSVSLSGDTALIGAIRDNNDKGSAYIFTKNGTNWTQQQELNASDSEVGDQFGTSVALDGDTALIGVPEDDDSGECSGSAYVFTRTGTIWTQQQKLNLSDGTAYDMFGNSVALEGNTAFIGAYCDDGYNGSAYVFTRSGTTWTQQQKLNASNGAEWDLFGSSVALDGNTALIGASGDDRKGSAYVFTRSGTTWTQQQKLNASDGTYDSRFGTSVSLDGDTALIGVPCQTENYSELVGAAYVFTRSGTTWTQQAKLLASDGNASDFFGFSTALSGNTAFIGREYILIGNDNPKPSMLTPVYVFIRTGATWTQEADLLASNDFDMFGYSISLVGDTALIGAPYGCCSTGAAYIYMRESAPPNIRIDITGGLGINANITNNGTAKTTSIPWQIHVQGGILGRINKTVNGTVDLLPGQSQTVGTGMFFGLGPLTVTVTAADTQKTIGATQLFVLSIIKK